MNNYSKEDMELMKKCFEKYQNRFGYITFYNHIQAYFDFMEQVSYQDGDKELFELRKACVIQVMTMFKEIAELHKVQGIPAKVDLEGL